MKNIYILCERSDILLAYESSIEASREMQRREFLDDGGIYKIIKLPFVGR